MTLQLLWEEYAAAHPARRYRYSQFCLLYQALPRRAQALDAPGAPRRREAVHRLLRRQRVPIIDAASGEIRRARDLRRRAGRVALHLRRGDLDASSCPIGSARTSAASSSWAAVPALLVPDNLKSAIKRACRYEPEANSTYADLARHYGTAILPARPFHPRDKAAVEAGVLLVAALDPGAPSQSPVLLARRAQRRDPRPARRA